MDDIPTLLALIKEKDKKIAVLEEKNRLLSAHVMELTQEMENIKTDFGRDR